MRKKGKKQKDFLVPKMDVKARSSRTRGPISTLEVINGVHCYRLLTHVFEVLIKLPPPKVISGLLSNIQKVGLFCVILGLFPSELSGTL